MTSASYPASRLASMRNADGGALARVPRSVGEKIVQHLHDAPPVGHHRGQVGRKFDENFVAAVAGEERVPGSVHQGDHLRGLRRDREGARIDASASAGGTLAGYMRPARGERVFTEI
ncbi:MAG: hypothetical protein OXU81_03205 [Gammaproteobacteria bacterium]|nr:hypothetical protein [Gammaproteobacteria bacterium]